MERYNLNLDLQDDHMVDDTCNMLTLRSDIHRAFDETVFPAVSPFLGVGQGKKLRLRVTKEDGLHEDIQTVKPKELAVMGLLRGRNLSPKKSKNASDTPAAESTETYTKSSS